MFPTDAGWARTQVLDAEATGVGEFDLDEFGRYRRIRILTYSSSTQMLSTVLDRFEEASVECVPGYSRGRRVSMPCRFVPFVYRSILHSECRLSGFIRNPRV
ncbi:MAG: hypothetical protein OXF79_02750 [Chloroflexi bacterium]|nr:hypothetical protein [Chloroflexota bacterium]